MTNGYSVQPGFFINTQPYSWSQLQKTSHGGKTVTMNPTGINIVGPTGSLLHQTITGYTYKYRFFGGNNYLLILENSQQPVTYNVYLVDFTTTPPTEKGIYYDVSDGGIYLPGINYSQGSGSAFLIYYYTGQEMQRVGIYRSDVGTLLCQIPFSYTSVGQTLAEATDTELKIHYDDQGISKVTSCALSSAGSPGTIGNPCTRMGQFVSANVIPPTSSGLSPTGNTKVVIVKNTSTGEILDLELQETATNRVIFTTGAIPTGVSASWGFSPDGQIFLYTSSASWSGVLVMAEGPQSGNRILNFSFASARQNAGWGFGPDSKTFLLATDYITIYDLKSSTVVVSTLTSNWGQWRYSPCGDLFVLIGLQDHGPVEFYRLPKGNLWPPTSNSQTVSVNVNLGGGNPDLKVVGQGVNGIQLGGMSATFVDNV
jgi:hypothetical protein